MSAGPKRPTPVLEVIEAAKPMHCPCGYPGCSRNELRADLTEARAAVTALVEALREASRALTDIDPLALHHDAALIDDALRPFKE